MRAFVFLLVFLAFASEVSGQVVQTIGPITCYVGETYDICTVRDTVIKSDHCKEGTHSCIYGFIQWYFPSLGIYKWPSYLINGSGTNELKYVFFDTLTFRDSVVPSYKMSEEGPNCGQSCSYGLYDTVFIISGVVKRDSVVKIRSIKKDIEFILDSSLHTYRTYVLNTRVYNHIN